MSVISETDLVFDVVVPAQLGVGVVVVSPSLSMAVSYTSNVLYASASTADESEPTRSCIRLSSFGCASYLFFRLLKISRWQIGDCIFLGWLTFRPTKKPISLIKYTWPKKGEKHERMS